MQYRSELGKGAIAAIVLACGQSGGGDVPSPVEVAAARLGPPESVYQRERRTEVSIELAAEDWERLRVDGRSMAQIQQPVVVDYQYTGFRADVTVDGVAYPDVEIKKKGFIGSLSVLRPSLRLDFDPERAGVDSGLRRLTLNADVQDRSHARQCMAFDLFAAAGIPASRCSFAHVVVNGVDLGTYTNVEPVNKPMLRRFYSDDEGPLFEGTLADFDAEGWERIELESDTGADKSELRRLVSALEASDESLVSELGAILDLDQFRDYWAMETLLGHWDGYAENANNYYLYFNPESERFEIIPWGLDQAFVGQRPFTPDFYHITVYARARLARRLYDLPEQRTLFRERLAELEAQLWDEAALLAQVDEIARLVPDEGEVALEAHRGFLLTHGDALRAALAEPAPEIIDTPEPPPPACPTPSRPIRGDFSLAWGLSEGSAEIQLELDGAPVSTTTFVASGSTDAMDDSRATLAFGGLLADGRSLLVLILLPEATISAGPHPFHSFETFGLVALTSEGFSTLGTIGDGELRFERGRPEIGAEVVGSFEAVNYQSACLGAATAGEAPLD